eukprot:1150997-Pelagomonas_calceolata.AAC.4
MGAWAELVLCKRGITERARLAHAWEHAFSEITVNMLFCKGLLSLLLPNVTTLVMRGRADD